MTETSSNPPETAVKAASNITDKERHSRAIETILAKLTNSYEASHYHPYLEDNDVGAFDLSVDDDGNLLGVGVDLKASFTGTAYIPKPRNLLTITPYGETSLEPGARVYGAALMIGHNQFRRIAKMPNGRHAIFVALDYATGAFLYENTGWPVAVAFRPSNVKSVVEILRQKFPRSQIVVCLNNEDGKSHGRDKARREARKRGAVVVYPQFSHEERNHSLISYNDMAMFSGPDRTLRGLMGQIEKETANRKPPAQPSAPESADSYGEATVCRR
ncbi:MAG: hypothetical protein LBV79_05560 [Candidatus Adiutrix sp.]|nr:hypothetical protein [Candidatus Adiutrix sp.]